MEVGGKAPGAWQFSVARMLVRRSSESEDGSARNPDVAFVHPGFGPGENYYGAGIESRLEMLLPRMS